MFNRRKTPLNLISNMKFNELRALGKKQNNEYKYFKPGMAWFCPWLFDPLYFSSNTYREEYSKRYFENLLSIYYWVDWSRKRSPITIMLPNQKLWCIDKKPSNSDGWRITGQFPHITAEGPDIINGWQGYLEDGTLFSGPKVVFLKELELF